MVLDTSGEPLTAALAAAPRIIKPNIHELEALIGAPLPNEAAIIAATRELFATGIALAVVSMGSARALFITAGEALRAVPPRVTACSTVGAGDAMVAGIVAAQARGYDLEASAPGDGLRRGRDQPRGGQPGRSGHPRRPGAPRRRVSRDAGAGVT